VITQKSGGTPQATFGLSEKCDEDLIAETPQNFILGMVVGQHPRYYREAGRPWIQRRMATSGEAMLMNARNSATLAVPAKYAVAGLLILAAGLFLYHASIYGDWAEDDAYITFRYAENLANGHGLVMNEGERVEGYSNFAWLLYAAAAIKGGVDPLAASRFAGLSAGLLTLFLSWKLACRLSPNTPAANTLAPLFLAASPMLARHSVSGLETSAFAAVLMSLPLLSEEAARTLLGRVALIVCALLLSLLRPEGIAFSIIFLCFPLLVAASTRNGNASIGGRSALANAIIFLCLFSVYYIWRWNYFDSLFTNTFYFKMTGGSAALRPGVHYTLDFLRENGGAALLGFALVLWTFDCSKNLLTKLSLVALVQVGIVVIAGGDWMYHYRFYTPLLPILAAAMAAGVGRVSEHHIGDGSRKLLKRSILLAVLLTSFLNIYKTERSVARLVLPSVNNEQYFPQSYQRVGEWIRENSDEGSLLAASDIGALSYFSKRTILDMFGLADSHISRTPGGLHSKSDSDYVLSRKPDMVALVEGLDENCQPYFRRLSDRTLYENAAFSGSYTPIRRFDIGYQNETVILYLRTKE
jgi:arabinofuranosyltransferase